MAGRRRLPVVFILGSLPWLAVLGWLSSLTWFLCDDAFISFRYVRNLLEGHGLVFNPGEYVEGYSNFLWVLELAALWGVLGIRPEQAAPWLSVVCTAGTLAAMLWWVAGTPGLRHRGWVAWMALGLVCSSATFAVWTSGGGLETRQFTLLVTLAVVCLLLHGRHRWGLLAASFSLAAAAYTRPEGPLIAACCFGWFVVQRLVETGRLRPDRRLVRELVWLVGPFVVLVAAHFLFRYAYYGEWLPNTYYAKHIRPWYEAGFRYLLTATLETGLYLLLPLAFFALRTRWQARRELAYALPLVCIVPHMAYLMRIGGDHFAYRPLDFYWPLLAVPASVGIVSLADRLRAWLRRPAQGQRGVPVGALALFLPVLFYTTFVQNTALVYREAEIDHPLLHFAVGLSALVAPGAQPLVVITADLIPDVESHFARLPASTLRDFAERRISNWSAYEHMERAAIPDDAVMAMGPIGVQPFYMPALTIVDIWGLTDATVARNPVVAPNHKRRIAHDRRPPPGYMEARGVNFLPRPAVRDGLWALTRANYAARVGPDLWMPFDTTDHQWAVDRFSGRELRVAGDDDRIQLLGNFEAGLDGWQLGGNAISVENPYDLPPDQLPVIEDFSGWGFLTSFHPRQGDAALGSARSPQFTAGPDDALAFLLAGGESERVGLRLLADGREVQVWRGEDDIFFNPVVYRLGAVAGKTLQLELFDDEVGPWGHIMLDHVTLVRGAGNSGPEAHPRQP